MSGDKLVLAEHGARCGVCGPVPVGEIMVRDQVEGHVRCAACVYGTNGARDTFAGGLTGLVEVLSAAREAAGEEDDGIDWTSLPTFGGEEPRDTSGVWSWDVGQLLVGTCMDDLAIVPRGAHVDSQRTG